MGGSFNFDPRGAWTTIDAGYSPDEQEHKVMASPVVEMLTAWGLENARPDEFEPWKARYAAWGVNLPPILARVALAGSSSIDGVPMKRVFALSCERRVRTKSSPLRKRRSAMADSLHHAINTWADDNQGPVALQPETETSARRRGRRRHLSADLRGTSATTSTRSPTERRSR